MLHVLLAICGMCVCGSIGFILGAIMSGGVIVDLQAEIDRLQTHNEQVERIIEEQAV